jgi:hypothetical protein
MIQTTQTNDTVESPIEKHAVDRSYPFFALQVNVDLKPSTHSEAVPDGGYTIPDVGSYAVDRDREAEVVVTEIAPARSATDVSIFRGDGPTVADLNPKYDDAAPPVKAIYTDIADKILDGWESVDDLRTAAQHGMITSRYFPADRLVVKRNMTPPKTGGAP